MYETYFRLQRRPFLGVPDVEHYFPASSIEQARGTLHRCIDRAMGFGLVVGAPGSGKTLLLQKLAADCASRHACALLAGAQLATAADLLRNILFELGLPYREMSEGELRLTLVDFLHSDRCREGMLLLIDEAHDLEPRLLEDVRLLTNVSRGGAPRLRLALAGCPALEEVLTHPKLESFNQRIAARCYLESLTRDETFGYIQSQLSQAGARGQIFTNEALAAVHSASGGIPRVINQLCELALTGAAAAQQWKIEVSGVEAAWTELQQIPAPWQEWRGQKTSSAESIVEFGTLDDEPHEPPTVKHPAATEKPAPRAGSDKPLPSEAVEFHAQDEFAVESGDPEMYSVFAVAPPSITVLSQDSVYPAASREGASQEPEFTPEESAVEPTLDSIEAAFAEIERLSRASHESEDDYTTAGMIGPEVELVFHDCDNPFAEEFLDEEVVIDHYASLDRAVLGAKVRVSCREDRQLTATLDQAETFEPPATSVIIEVADETATVEFAGEADDKDTDLEPEALEEIDIVHPPAEDLAKVTERYDQRCAHREKPAGVENCDTCAREAALEHADPPETLALRVTVSDDEPPHEASLKSGDDVLIGDDRDVIVVDEPVEPPPPSVPAATRVRREEYRQLFAQLRRR